MVASQEIFSSFYDKIQQTSVDKTINNNVRGQRIRKIRAEALSAHLASSLSQARIVQLGPWIITIGGVSLINEVVELYGVTVVRNGNPIPLDPHRIFINPPLLFPDPNGPIIRMEVDPNGTPLNPLVREVRYRIDPAAVILNEIVMAAEAGGP